MALKLFIGNLPRSATESTLSELVTNAGFHVASAVVIRDRMTGDSKGFGFVELAEGDNLQGAIQSLDGQTLEGRPLTVNEARPQRTGFSKPRPGGGGRGGFNKRRRDW
jgi:cold-inducible RNA-binding protein